MMTLKGKIFAFLAVFLLGYGAGLLHMHRIKDKPCETTVVKQDVKVKRGGQINNQVEQTGGSGGDIDPCDTLSRKEKRALRRNGK